MFKSVAETGLSSTSAFLARATAIGGIALLCSCTSAPEGGRLERHGSVDLWTHAALQQVEQPQTLVPEAALLVAVPILYHYDDDLQSHMVAHPSITGGDTSRGNAATFALGAASVGWAAGQWIGGDSAQSLEICAESIAMTTLTTEALKVTVRRTRPIHDSSSSFPSGHSAFSFCTATFLARSVWDSTDSWWRGAGYLAYLPAAYVGINRIESERHFPSDVAAGALVGTFLTNWIYDAHMGDAKQQRAGIFEAPHDRHEIRCSLEPLIDDRGVGLAWFVRF